MEGIAQSVIGFDDEIERVRAQSRKHNQIWERAQHRPQETGEIPFNPQDPNTWIVDGKKVSDMSLDELIDFSTRIYNQASAEYLQKQEEFTIASLNLKKATEHYQHYQTIKKQAQVDGNKGLASLLGNQIEADLSDINSYSKKEKTVDEILKQKIEERLKNEGENESEGQTGNNQAAGVPSGDS